MPNTEISKNRFIYASKSAWYGSGGTAEAANKAKYANSIVFIHEDGDTTKGTTIFAHGSYYDISKKADKTELNSLLSSLDSEWDPKWSQDIQSTSPESVEMKVWGIKKDGTLDTKQTIGKFKKGTNITFELDGTNGLTINAQHPTIKKTDDSTSTDTPGFGDEVTMVDGITRDEFGHVTTINTKTITLPTVVNTGVTSHKVAGDDGFIKLDNNGKTTGDVTTTLTTTYGDFDTSKDGVATVNNTSDFVTAKIDDALTSALVFVGGYNASSNTYPTEGSGKNKAIKKGDTWVITNAGTLGGEKVEVGDMLIAKEATPAQEPTKWTVVNKNIDGVVTVEGNLTTDHIVIASGDQSVKDSGKTLDGFKQEIIAAMPTINLPGGGLESIDNNHIINKINLNTDGTLDVQANNIVSDATLVGYQNPTGTTTIPSLKTTGIVAEDKIHEAFTKCDAAWDWEILG